MNKNNQEFNELKEEIHKFKQELIEENQKQTPPNIIKYKFFATNKKIPWLLGGENINPTPDIEDSWFNFIQLPDKIQFNFETPFRANIVVNDDSLTYWKVERYKNGVKDKTYYFYSSRLLRYLKNGFELELSLDIYMTYTKDIINKLKNKQQAIKFNRMTITNSMLDKTDGSRQTVLNSLKTVDDVVLNGDSAYSEAKPVPIGSLNDFGLPNYRFPLVAEDAVNNILTSKLNIFDNNNNFIPRGALNFRQKSGVSGVGYGSIQIRKDGRDSIIYAKEYADFEQNALNKIRLTQEEQMEISKYVMQQIKLRRFIFDNSTVSEKKFNENMMNSYFAVFRTTNGDIDAYPILGKFKANFEVPVIKDGVFTNTATGNVPDASENNRVSTSIPLQRNRIYCGYGTYADMTIENDWESIYSDYVRNLPNNYSNKSFIGVYRGIISTGLESKMHWVVAEESSTMRFSILNGSDSFYYPKIKRIVYKMKYNEFMNLEINDWSSDLPSSAKFSLVRKSDFLENYVDLLEPLNIGSTEIVPARFSFLADIRNEFSIPAVNIFLDSFTLYLKNSLYNNASYSINLGGTLPTETNTYQQQLDIINQQKNAGVWSSVGNILARPLNWLSGSLGKNIGFSTASGSSTAIGDDFDAEGPSLVNRAVNSEDSRKGFSFGIGGLGGFIGDGINIWSTIKQAEIAKRNIGPGYLTSSMDDMLSAVVQNDFTKYAKNWQPSQKGLFSAIFKKKFTPITRQKYINYYNLYGFNIQEWLPSSYLTDIINYANSNPTRYGFIQIDKDWCLTNLEELSNFNDNAVKVSIINQLSSGLRLKKFN